MQPLPKRIFVAGIGTGVGKTLASAVLVEALQADYWKPIQCGNLDNSDTQVVQSLISNPTSNTHTETYRFKTASSPHYAARMEKSVISNSAFSIPNSALVIESAGGLMVPLNNDSLVIDLVKQFDASVVLVVRNYLGSINHTLLSIELLKQRGVHLLGMIFNGQNFFDNEEIIQHFGKIPVLGRIDEAQHINKEFVKEQAEKMRVSLSQKFQL